MRILVILFSLCVSVDSLAQGKQLHDNHCMQCHSSLTNGKPNSLYTRSDRIVNSSNGLTQRVENCAVAADVNWTPDQLQQVVKYLDTTFYQFD